jgi:hypothetical protein
MIRSFSQSFITITTTNTSLLCHQQQTPISYTVNDVIPCDRYLQVSITTCLLDLAKSQPLPMRSVLKTIERKRFSILELNPGALLGSVLLDLDSLMKIFSLSRVTFTTPTLPSPLRMNNARQDSILGVARHTIFTHEKSILMSFPSFRS